MKKIIVPLLVYLIVCIIAVMLPASDGYNTIGWKLLIGQIYAIPVLIIAFLISFFLHRRLSH
ncbi:DUF4017 family protein [Solibacillus sp. FSL K6-1781]|uniref:DUF4017 domain-containing protein n=1 Tax=Solibacillus kalamii TaxID=1748298 RepID=A0ABX3ZHS2_9BACL|nr:DUF4017 family protein [Solibacillus kalamii]OUZ39118.1 hypothetical protein CBM15_09650 [Solibacillus kalamii]